VLIGRLVGQAVVRLVVRRGETGHVLGSLSPPRRRFVLAVVGLVLAAVVAAVAGVVVHVVRSRQDPVTPVPQDAQPPVLLVPGYGGDTSDLAGLAGALRSTGRLVTIVHLAGDGKGDLSVQAGVLEAAVRRELDVGASSVDVVGYSAGGVTARLWVERYGGGSVARRVISLGSPQHGTELASLATDVAPDSCPMACRQLAIGSSLIRGLNEGDETPAGPQWVSIWTNDDRVSTPPLTARLDGALDFSVQSVCPGLRVTHSQLPVDPAVVAMVLRELGRPMPAVPPSSVCGAR
jgi:triacylglycerol lipase